MRKKKKNENKKKGEERNIREKMGKMNGKRGMGERNARESFTHHLFSFQDNQIFHSENSKHSSNGFL